MEKADRCFGTLVPKRTHVYIEYFVLRELDFAKISIKVVNVIPAAYNSRNRLQIYKTFQFRHSERT